MDGDVLDRARTVAESVLLPDADAVDAADRVPRHHLTALDTAGLTGLGAHSPDLATRTGVTAALAGGSLATAFVWLQHQGVLGQLAAADGPARELLPPLTDGRRRAGLAITGLRPPDPLRLQQTAGGWRLSGTAPWVTGWGGIDLLLVAALDGDLVRSVLIDAAPAPSISAEPLNVVAARAARTHTLRFAAHPVPAERLVRSVPLAELRAGDQAGLAGNGALALGVAARALALLGPSPLDARLDAAWHGLLTADPAALPQARADASALALTAATALAVRSGARGALRNSAADRLLREAHLLLVFGGRPAIRSALLSVFSAEASQGDHSAPGPATSIPGQHS